MSGGISLNVMYEHEILSLVLKDESFDCNLTTCMSVYPQRRDVQIRFFLKKLLNMYITTNILETSFR
jgi:hypothetical protein